MTGLEYDRYAVHGGDWCGAVAHTLMTEHPEAVVAAHLTDIPFYLHFLTERDDLEPHERAFLDAADARQEEPQYYRLQAGKPLTLSYAMADSPAALLAWLTGLYTAWTDREIDEDAVLANASLYWLTNSFHSSVRFYSEGTDAWDEPDGEEAGWDDDADEAEWGAAEASVPTAFAIHPADIVVPTRSYAERYFTVERFTLLMGAGGHFAAMESPDALADDITAFRRPVLTRWHARAVKPRRAGRLTCARTLRDRLAERASCGTPQGGILSPLLSNDQNLWMALGEVT